MCQLTAKSCCLCIIGGHFISLLIIHVSDHHFKAKTSVNIPLTSFTALFILTTDFCSRVSPSVSVLILLSSRIWYDLLPSPYYLVSISPHISPHFFIFFFVFSPMFALREWNGDPVYSKASVNSTPETAGRKFWSCSCSSLRFASKRNYHIRYVNLLKVPGHMLHKLWSR